MVSPQQLLIIAVAVMSIHVLFATINGGYGLDIIAKTEVMKYNGTSIKSYDGHFYDKIGSIFVVSFFMFLADIFFYIFTICKICAGDIAINFPLAKFIIYAHLLIHGIFTVAIASTQLTLSYVYDDISQVNYDTYNSFHSNFMSYVEFQIKQIIANYVIGAVLIVVPCILPWINCKISRGAFIAGPIAFPYVKFDISLAN